MAVFFNRSTNLNVAFIKKAQERYNQKFTVEMTSAVSSAYNTLSEQIQISPFKDDGWRIRLLPQHLVTSEMIAKELQAILGNEWHVELIADNTVLRCSFVGKRE